MTASELGLGTDPLPQDAADVFVQWNRVNWAVPGVELPANYSAYYFGDDDPKTIPGADTEDSHAGGITKISDLTEDFSYSANLVSKSDGLRIGALHWNDQAFDGAASIARIRDAYKWTLTGFHDVLSDPTFDLNNFPNPFQSTTTITYNLPGESHVNLEVYHISGQMVAKLVDTQQQAGPHAEQFNPHQAEAGTYFCKLTSDHSTSTRKMVVVK
ncbi:MAG: T9SS type A sorting domain-containing protein [Bacteroidota bacterium]